MKYLALFFLLALQASAQQIGVSVDRQTGDTYVTVVSKVPWVLELSPSLHSWDWGKVAAGDPAPGATQIKLFFFGAHAKISNRGFYRVRAINAPTTK